MSKMNKKKQILTATLAIAMASAIAVNWYYNNNEISTDSDTTTVEQQTNLGDSIYVNGNTDSEENNEDVTDAVKTEEYFAKAQLKRTQAHDAALDEIQGLIENDAEYEEIQTLLDEYTDMIKLETDIENLITAKIDSNCLAIINGEQAEIVVEGEAIDELYMLQITEIVSTQTDIPAENIIIIQAK